MMLSEKIYYVDQHIKDTIDKDFELISQSGFYELFRSRTDGSYWRLDPVEKYTEQFFVLLETLDNWDEFNSSELEMGLLLKTRGNTDKKCLWKGCDKFALKELAFCEVHAYTEMGWRK